jgi:5-methylcytosine-specific restriction endonuclease McrA
MRCPSCKRDGLSPSDFVGRVKKITKSCRRCGDAWRAGERIRRHANPEGVRLVGVCGDIVTHLRCIGCHRTLPDSNFVGLKGQPTKSCAGCRRRDPARQASYQDTYRRTLKGEARRKSYRASPNAKALARLYSKTPKAKAKLAIYRKTPTYIAGRVTQRSRRRHGAGGKMTGADYLFICELFSGECAYCCVLAASGSRHVDHVVPLAKGGPNLLNNLVIACETCNLSKRERNWIPWFRDQLFWTPTREALIQAHLDSGIGHTERDEFAA